MKVLHVYRTYFPDTQGGLEEVVRQICRNTKPLGVQSRVFTLSDNPSPDVLHRDEGDVIQVKKTFEVASCGFGLTSWSAFKKQVAWADLVHYQFPWPFADMLHFYAGSTRPSILSYQSDVVRQQALYYLYQPLMNHFLGSMKRIVATSPNYLATSEVLQKHADKVDIVPNGIDENSYPAPSDIKPEIESTKSRYGEEFFLFVGVLRYYKGLHVLLQAMQGAPYKVIIVGKGPEEEQLRRQAQQLQLNNVIFTGYIGDNEKMALMHVCRGVVFPSHLRSEAFGITLLEGAMCGKPLISANIGTGTTYINIDRETGIVVEPESPASLRQAMNTLHADPMSASSLGQAARARYEGLFTGAHMGESYRRIYQQVMAEHGGV